MHPRPRLLLCLGLLFCLLPLTAQDLSLPDFNAANLGHQRGAMYVLGGWAALNITGGLILRGRTTGEARRFHEMNALWNTVNLAIAGAGYYSAVTADPSGWDLATSLGKQHGFEKVLLFNAGLDVGYVMGGLYLRERANRPDADRDQLRGYGNAVILQGGFLFAFDLVNYFLASGRVEGLDLRLGQTAEGVGMILTF